MNHRIKALLILQGKKQVEIARKLRITRSAVSRVVSGRSRSPRIRKAVADVLGMAVEELWPEDKNKAA